MPIYIFFPLLASASIGIIFMNFPPLSQEMMALYNVEHGGLALLFSALFWSHALFQIPAGLIVDRVGPFKIILLSILLIIICNLLPLLKLESLTLAISTRFIMGLGTSSLFLSVVKLISILIPPEKIPLAQGLQGGFFSLGLLAPYLSFPYLKDMLNFAFIIPVILFIILLFTAFLLPKEKLKKTKHKNPLVTNKLINVLTTLIKSKTIWIMGISHGLLYGTMNNLGQWMPSIINDNSSKTISWAALATAIILITGALSRSFGSKLLKYTSQEKLNIFTILFSSIFCFLLAIPSNIFINISIAIILAVFCGLSYGSLFAITNKSFPFYIASAIGFMNMLANLISSFLTVFLGNTRELTGSFSFSLIILAFIFLIFYILIFKQTDLSHG